MVGKPNLEKRLRQKAIRVNQESAWRALRETWASMEREEAVLSDAISTPFAAQKIPGLNCDKLKPENIFHLSEIKSICITYRLRFLDSHLFKGKIPPEALLKAANLAREHKTNLQNFKILAPGKQFQLDDANDPMLFIPLGGELYYLIHKWGADLNRWRKLWVYPLQNTMPMFWTINALSLLFAALFPLEAFASNAPNWWRIAAFFWFFKVLSASVIFLGPKLFVNFSSVLWDSEYFNA